MKNKIIDIVALSAQYCNALQNINQYEKRDFIMQMCSLLPKIYWNFLDITSEETMEENYLPEYLDEQSYETIRTNIARLMQEDDVFLETFEEDMKYSDTPVAASISESLADIFQPLYDFIENVHQSQGDLLVEAYADCREKFTQYWSGTLCNVLRPLNNLLQADSQA